MPYKHAESRRHKFTKPKYKVTNWPEYNDALRKRSDITIWWFAAYALSFSPELSAAFKCSSHFDIFSPIALSFGKP